MKTHSAAFRWDPPVTRDLIHMTSGREDRGPRRTTVLHKAQLARDEAKRQVGLMKIPPTGEGRPL